MILKAAGVLNELKTIKYNGQMKRYRYFPRTFQTTYYYGKHRKYWIISIVNKLTTWINCCYKYPIVVTNISNAQSLY